MHAHHAEQYINHLIFKHKNSRCGAWGELSWTLCVLHTELSWTLHLQPEAANVSVKNTHNGQWPRSRELKNTLNGHCSKTEERHARELPQPTCAR